MKTNKNARIYKFVGFEVLTVVVMNVAIFCDLALCSPYVNRRCGEMYHLHIQRRKSAEKETSMQQVASQNAIFLSSFFTLMMEVIKFLQNVGSHTDYTALYPRIWQHSYINLIGAY
jgi:hypothetical protein